MIIKIGNIFESKAKTLVNTINCVGVMGKGVALEFKKRYPLMYEEYVRLCEEGKIKPGEPYYYTDLTGTSIINFPTKEHWRSPSKLSYIRAGLDWIVENYEELGLTSVAIPPLGCGNGGLKWEIVGPVIYEKLKDIPLDIELYAPYGTKPEHLTEDFLKKNLILSDKEVFGDRNGKFNEKWLLILYVVQQLSSYRYSLHVGRTIFQKICYVMTRSGVKTGFEFSKGSYGPYCKEIKDSLAILSNANLLSESQLGSMMQIHVLPQFSIDLGRYSEQEISATKKTIDLFSRIKSTDQAELISTVLFSYDTIKKTKNEIFEKDIYEFVINWKPRWEQDKGQSISGTIRNLAVLGWLEDIKPSKDLPFSDEID